MDDEETTDSHSDLCPAWLDLRYPCECGFRPDVEDDQGLAELREMFQPD